MLWEVTVQSLRQIKRSVGLLDVAFYTETGNNEHLFSGL
jgi:hypothetical protein